MKKQAYNPFLPSYEYIPDGESYVFGDRVYIFGSHDRFNGKTFCMNNYVCWSALVDNLSDWTYEGEIYSKFQDPLVYKESSYMYAPDIQIGPDGRYYLYYFIGFSGIISVAVSDKPTGKFEFYGHVKYKNGVILGRSKNDPFMFDPGVLVDDDHRVYLYTGFKPKFATKLFLLGRGKLDSYVTELEADMITVKQSPNKLEIIPNPTHQNDLTHHTFFEASSIRKINNLYYFIYSSELNHELCYATSNSPKGPFAFGGTIISNAGMNLDEVKNNKPYFYFGNNHGSIAQINSKWFVFYHRQTNRQEYSRQACAEEIVFDHDGSIEQVEMTSCGFNNGPLKGVGTYPSHITCVLFSKKGAGSYSPLLIFKSYKKHPYLTQSGIDREDNPDQYVANIRHGSIVGYKYFKFEYLTNITIEISGHALGNVEVYVELGVKPIASIPISVFRHIASFSSNTITLNDIHPLYFKFVGKGYINLISFSMK